MCAWADGPGPLRGFGPSALAEMRLLLPLLLPVPLLPHRGAIPIRPQCRIGKVLLGIKVLSENFFIFFSLYSKSFYGNGTDGPREWWGDGVVEELVVMG